MDKTSVRETLISLGWRKGTKDTFSLFQGTKRYKVLILAVNYDNESMIVRKTQVWEHTAYDPEWVSFADIDHIEHQQ